MTKKNHHIQDEILYHIEYGLRTAKYVVVTWNPNPNVQDQQYAEYLHFNGAKDTPAETVGYLRRLPNNYVFDHNKTFENWYYVYLRKKK